MINLKKLLLLLFVTAQFVCAARVSLQKAEDAAGNFSGAKFKSKSRSISTTSPLEKNSETIGFVVALNPVGFVLTRADDELPFVKLYSDSCNYSDLPPDFLEVMEWELSTELSVLDTEQRNNKAFVSPYKKEWENLLSGNAERTAANAPVAAGMEQVGPLLTTYWNQDSPYNYYAPAASGGPGGRAYAGCVACAMAQILKYHNYPITGRGTHTYTDSYGDCTGTHSVDFSATTYDWSKMPDTINNSSSTASKQAIGLLMYHCGVAVNMNFEANGSGAYSQDVPEAFRNYFKYDCLDLIGRPSSSRNDDWYHRVENDISKSRPIYYSFSSGANGSGGHAVVVDGCRNGNEFHVNFGWGNTYPPSTAWYNMDDINGFNYNHDAVFGICEEGTLDDDYEPNNSKTDAYDISSNFNQWLSSISNEGIQANEDWYKFTLDVVPDLIVITCAFVNAEGDLVLELYDDSGKIAESQTENDGEVIEYYANAPCTYYIKVDSANGNAYPYSKEYWLNNYDLMVTAPEGVSIFSLITLIIITLRRKL